MAISSPPDRPGHQRGLLPGHQAVFGVPLFQVRPAGGGDCHSHRFAGVFVSLGVGVGGVSKRYLPSSSRHPIDPDFIVLRPFGERVPPGRIVGHLYPFGTKVCKGEGAECASDINPSPHLPSAVWYRPDYCPCHLPQVCQDERNAASQVSVGVILITDTLEPSTLITHALSRYMVGPPYVMHRDTWKEFAPLWSVAPTIPCRQHPCPPLLTPPPPGTT